MDEFETQISFNPLISVQNICHSFGKKQALNDVSFDIMPGEIISLLGPSGCGKTTMLRLIAGFEEPASGSIAQNGKVISVSGHLLPPEKRDMGLVFQSYALFPHMTVEENVCFGLKNEVRKNAQDIDNILEKLDIIQLRKHYPQQISGGQQQRVAIARALAPSPHLILLDEPFSGLDSRLRERVRDNMLHVLKSHNIAVVMVTHDAEEAMFMSDKIVVLREGHVMQTGRPIDLYCRPQNAFVAEFFGEVNKIAAHASIDGQIECIFGKFLAPEVKANQNAVMLVRQEGLNIHTQKQTDISAKVESTHMLGSHTLVHMNTQDPDTGENLHLHARLPGLNFLEIGQDVYLEVDPAQAFIYSTPS